MSTNSFDTSNLTDEQVNEIINNGGFEGSLKAGINVGANPTVITPTVHTPISGYGHSIRPRTNGQDPNTEGGLVTKPNLKLHMSNHEEQMAKLHAEEQERKDHQRQLQEALEPSKLLAQLNAMDRKIRKLEKANKDLTGQINAITEATL